MQICLPPASEMPDSEVREQKGVAIHSSLVYKDSCVYFLGACISRLVCVDVQLEEGLVALLLFLLAEIIRQDLLHQLRLGNVLDLGSLLKASVQVKTHSGADGLPIFLV